MQLALQASEANALEGTVQLKIKQYGLGGGPSQRFTISLPAGSLHI